jgi:hypothetical protein
MENTKRAIQLPVTRSVLKGILLVTLAYISDFLDGSKSTLKSVELNTEGTRKPMGRAVPAGELAIVLRNSPSQSRDRFEKAALRDPCLVK